MDTFDCFPARFVHPFSKKKTPNFQNARKAGKQDKLGHNFVIFSQTTGQTWHHTGGYHLSTLVSLVDKEQEIRIVRTIVNREEFLYHWLILINLLLNCIW